MRKHGVPVFGQARVSARHVLCCVRGGEGAWAISGRQRKSTLHPPNWFCRQLEAVLLVPPPPPCANTC